MIAAQVHAPTSASASGLWEVLNSNFAVMLGAFVLTTILGSWLATVLQHGAWRRQTRIELLRERYSEGTALLECLSQLIGHRFFAAQRYLWAIENQKEYDLTTVATEYHHKVAEWNARIWEVRNKIRLLLSEQHANQFLDYRDDNRGQDVRSLHYQFVILGRTLRSARNGSVTVDAAQAQVYRLNWACSNLLERFTTDFQKRAAALELLDVGDAQQPTPRPQHHGPL
jgi:hypothetical protein